MKTVTACVGACVGGVLSTATLAQVRYNVEPQTAWIEVYCLPPCACPQSQLSGMAAGTFTLTLTNPGPLFNEYSVTLVDWLATVPTGTRLVSGSGTYTIGGEVAIQHRMQLDLVIDGAAPLHYDSGLVLADPQNPFPRIGIYLETQQFVCRLNVLELVGSPRPCYPNCDESTTTPVLNVNDFVCFMNRFAAGDLYCDCDHSTMFPVLNVNDFLCFMNSFAAGCS
ncbi:MAG: GC-type dockerin domain-anchored protein [Phycisphaerales bacterium]